MPKTIIMRTIQCCYKSDVLTFIFNIVDHNRMVEWIIRNIYYLICRCAHVAKNINHIYISQNATLKNFRICILRYKKCIREHESTHNPAVCYVTKYRDKLVCKHCAIPSNTDIPQYALSLPFFVWSCLLP